MPERGDLIRQWASEGLSERQIVARLKEMDGGGGVRSAIRGLPGYQPVAGFARKIAGAVLNPIEAAKGAYEQLGAGIHSTTMAVPEGLFRLYGMGEQADVLGTERARVQEEVGAPEGLIEGASRFAGSVAPYAIAGMSQGPNLIRGMAAGAAVDVPVGAAARDMSLAGMAADYLPEGSRSQALAETVAESPALRGITEGVAGVGAELAIAKGLPAAYKGLRGMGEEGHAINLFGENVDDVVEQTDALAGPRGMSDAVNDARATVSQLEAKVEAGAATNAEVARYNEARSVLRASEGRGLDEAEVAARSPAEPAPDDNLDMFEGAGGPRDATFRPAVQVDGKVYTGLNHGDALEKASAATGRSVDEIVDDARGTNRIDLFQADDGTLLDRFQTSERHGFSATENLPPELDARAADFELAPPPPGPPSPEVRAGLDEIRAMNPDGYKDLGVARPPTTDELQPIGHAIAERHQLDRVELVRANDKTVRLVMLETPEGARGRGRGTDAMRDLIRWADENGETLTLQVAEPVGRLTDFYSRFGFVKNRGRHKDFALSRYADMYRRPRERATSGAAHPALVSSLAGASVGAATGAAVDDENRLRGAAIGGLAGAAAPAAYGRLRGMGEAGHLVPPGKVDPLEAHIRGIEAGGFDELEGEIRRIEALELAAQQRKARLKGTADAPPEPEAPSSTGFEEMSDDQLLDKWRQYQRGKGRTEHQADISYVSDAVRTVRDDETVTAGLADRASARGMSWGQKARGRQTQAEARVSAIEAEINKRGLATDAIDPYRDIGRSDVMPENKDLVGSGGTRLREMSDGDLEYEIAESVAKWNGDRELPANAERMAILYAEANREGRKIDMSVFGGVPAEVLTPLASGLSGAAIGAATADEDERPAARALAGFALGAGAGLAGLAVAKRADNIAGIARREFTVEGDLPKSVFRSKVAKDSWIGSQESQITFTLRDFRRAVRQEYGKLKDTDLAYIDDVLKGEADASTLAPKTREAVVRMRGEIDAMSRRLIDSGLVEGEMAARIDENMGVYTTRSYRVFDDPDWAKKVEPEVRNKAKALLRSEYPDLQDSEIEGLIERLLYKAEDAPMRLVRGSRLGAKDLSTLQRRKDIPPEIRALWGEYKDPRVNYARSVTKMAHMIGNHRFLMDVRAQGLGSFLHEQPLVRDGLEFKAKLAADQSSVMEPLNGLYTTPEIKQAFDQAFGKDGAPEWLEAYYRVNAVVKYGKTVGSVQTHVRNTVGNIGFAVANGHWRVDKLADAIGAVGTKLGAMGDDEWRAYYRRMQELGVVDESAYAGELRAAIKDAGQDPSTALQPDTGLLRKAVEGVTSLYRAEDDLWKVYAFENERARYAGALQGASPEQVDRMAAEIVRNTYPTYSMIPQGIRRVRRFPVVGTFVSFPAEVFRVGKNTILQAAKELKDPALRTIGAQRLAGIMAAAVGVPAVAIGSRHLTGVTKDEEDDIRVFLPSWSRNSNLVHMGKTEDGKYRYVDLSYTDPYSYLRKPVMAFMRGEDWERALLDATREAAEPFASEEIGVQHLVDIARNTKKESGGRVYNPQAPVEEQALAIGGHLWDAIEPGTVSSAQRIMDGIDGEVTLYGRSYNPKLEAMAVMTGHRVTEFDVRQAVSFKARDIVESVRDARAVLTSTLARSGTVTPEEVGEAQQDTQASLERLYGDLHRVATAAERMGMSRREVLTALNDAGLSRPDAAAVYAGLVPEYQPSQQFFRNLAERVRATGGDVGTVLERQGALRGYRPPELVAP